MEITICWSCANAFGGCSWSKAFKPVENWTATRKDVKTTKDGYVESYIVHDCPLYEGEKDDKGSKGENGVGLIST